MKRHHKVLLGAGVLAFVLAWIAWTVLLTESEVPASPSAGQAG